MQLAVFSNVNISAEWSAGIEVVGVPFPLTPFPSPNPAEMRDGGRWGVENDFKKEEEIHISAGKKEEYKKWIRN